MTAFRVAKTELSLGPDLLWSLDSAMQFRSPADKPAEWMVVRSALPIEVPKTDLLFDSGGSWAAYAGPIVGFTDFVQFGVENGARFAQARMQIDDKTKIATVNWQDEIGWTFPFDELFFLNAFSLQDTLLLHSMSCVAKGKGFLFCGVSGAGKSTLGAILENAQVEVLCDERNAVSLSGNDVLMSSTPFYGTSEKAFCGQAPLAAIVLLDPSHQGCALEKLSIDKAVAEIFPTLFLPQYSRQKIDATLNTFSEVILRTPIFKLNYDKSTTDVCSFLNDRLFCQG